MPLKTHVDAPTLRSPACLVMNGALDENDGVVHRDDVFVA